MGEDAAAALRAAGCFGHWARTLSRDGLAELYLKSCVLREARHLNPPCYPSSESPATPSPMPTHDVQVPPFAVIHEESTEPSAQEAHGHLSRTIKILIQGTAEVYIEHGTPDAVSSWAQVEQATREAMAELTAAWEGGETLRRKRALKNLIADPKAIRVRVSKGEGQDEDPRVWHIHTDP